MEINTDSTESPEPKSRSQSEQPASCPICGAVIRQSRNLRRHLELRHFSKPAIKKERKSKSERSVSAALVRLIYWIFVKKTGGTNSTLPTVTVKKEPEDIPSTSQQAQQQVQQQQQPTIAVSIASAQGTQHTLVDAGNANDNQPQHIVTQQENTDGTTSLSIAQVQPLTSTHQLTLSNINQVCAYPPQQVHELANRNSMRFY